jgi:hypothetical protein
LSGFGGFYDWLFFFWLRTQSDFSDGVLSDEFSMTPVSLELYDMYDEFISAGKSG